MHTNTYLGQRLILRIAHFYGDLYEKERFYFSLVDYFMKSVSATPISLFVVSLIMSLLCMNDVIEKKDR